MKKLILNQLISRKEQTGQAMVEYAILLTVMITLIAGGVEIGLAAFNSNRTAEAAKAGATEWLSKGLRYAIDDGSGSSFIGVDNNGVVRGIGDHTSSEEGAGKGNFSNPICDPSGHENGLPTDSIENGGSNNKIYLFNPLPLDITKCPSASGAEFSNFVELLPKVNIALLSLYVKECSDGVNTIDCSSADTAGSDKVYLRLPGGAHIGDAPDAMTKLGIFNDEGTTLLTSSGQDFLVSGIPAVGAGTVTPAPISPQGFIDTFRMHCRVSSPILSSPYTNEFPSRLEEDNCRALCYDSDLTVDSDSDGNLTNDGHTDNGPPRACDVRITIRYRHVFESLVMMMGWKDPVQDIYRGATDSPFVDDSNPDTLARGVLGTEVTRGFVLKPQKTFLGCNETTSVINKTISSGVTSGANSIEVRSCN